MNATNAAAKAAPAPAPTSDDPLADGLDTYLGRIRSNPRRYLIGVIGTGVAALAIILAVSFWRTAEENKATELSLVLLNASTTVEPSERVAVLNDAAQKTKGTPSEAYRLYLLAGAYRFLANKSTTQTEKVDAWKNCVAALQQLESGHPDSIWVKMPAKSGVVDPGERSVANTLKSLAEEQLRWLTDHPYLTLVTPDKDLSVTIEFESGGSIKIGKFFSKVAPYTVSNFVGLARDGYFDGTAFGSVERWLKKSAANPNDFFPVGIRGGSPLTRVTPDDRADDDLEGSLKNDLPYSLPDEQNAIPIGRGTLTAKYDFVAGGVSPTRFSIYSEELGRRPDGVPFAEVTEGLEILDGFVAGEVEADRPDRLRSLLRIKKVTVTGSVEFPPAAQNLPRFTPDLLPKVEGAAAAATTTESQPTSR